MSKSKITPLPGENELTPAQARLVTCMLSGSKVRDAARDAGIVEKTAFNYLNMPHVKKAIATGTAEIMKSAIERLQFLALAGLDVIVEIMNDRDNPAHVRLKAAHILASRFTEMKPAEAEQAEEKKGIDYSAFLPEELDVLYPIFAEVDRREAEKRKQA